MDDAPDEFLGSYNVELDAYQGPLDLLLYLIRKAEVDIYNIPIADITSQYLSYLDLMRGVNITVAGEFVLMAATLIEIKSRMLLPREQFEETEEEEEDPRMQLVRQLLEYKRFKDTARLLDGAQDEQLMRFPRPALDRDAAAPSDSDADMFEGVSLWDLLTAFSKVLKETRLNEPRVIYEKDKPLRYFMLMVLEALRDQGRLQFRELFVDLADRMEVIGVFLAILELARLKRIKAEQAKDFGGIYLYLGEDDPQLELPDDDALGYAVRPAADAPEEAAAEPAADSGAPAAGGEADLAEAEEAQPEDAEDDEIAAEIAGIDVADVDLERLLDSAGERAGEAEGGLPGDDADESDEEQDCSMTG